MNGRAISNVNQGRPLTPSRIEEHMFDRMPSRLELAIFELMAVTCAAVVSLFPKYDYAMMFVSMPVFFVAAVMGLRRNEQVKLRKAQVAEPEDQPIP
jgi:hypothetical protein